MAFNFGSLTRGRGIMADPFPTSLMGDPLKPAVTPPTPGWHQNFTQGFQNNPNAIMATGMALLAHRQNAAANPLGNAAQAMLQGGQIDTVNKERKAEAEQRQRTLNQTAQYLYANKIVPSYEAGVLAVEAGAHKEMIANHLKPKEPQQPDWINVGDGTVARIDPGASEPRYFQAPGANAPEPPKFSDISSMRKEIQDLPSYKSYQAAQPVYNSMVKSLDSNSKAADLDFVYGIAKVFDPTSVVRGEEMVMVQNTAGLDAQILGLINAVNGGQRLTRETREALLETVRNRVSQYEQQFQGDLTAFQEMAPRYGINPADIMPRVQPLTPFTPSAAAGPQRTSKGVTYTVEP